MCGILRTSLLCTAVAWLTNFCCSLGNVLSFVPARDQSYPSFVAAVIVWCHLLVSVVLLITLTFVLLPRRFVDSPDRAPTFCYCFTKLMKTTAPAFIGSLVLLAATAYLMGMASAGVQATKLIFYIDCICTHLYTTHADLAARRIVQQETVQPQPRSHPQATPNQNRIEIQPAPSPAHLRQVTPVASLLQARQNGRQFIYCQRFVRTSPMAIFVAAAGFYIHISSHINISRTQVHLLLFTCGSVLLKICMQEIAKSIALKRNVNDMRAMCVAVGIPTVLIDTQIRLMLQRMQSTQTTVAGTFLMALFEMLMRIAKAVIVKFEIRKRERPRMESRSVTPDSDTMLRTATTHNQWKRRVWGFHSAELHADMSAEYIAIGCSTSILHFFSSHPKYNFADNGSLGNSDASYRLSILFVQVGVEILVDFIAMLLEINGGVDFQELLKHSEYITSFFVNLAIINTHISAVICAVNN
ncbi:hypothetical protein FI667_g13614, partial [Globisporangium splendens]